ncbi:MAG: hypothetical protein TR69_WS6001001305 [candidate division WS6 bacterium OLB20]|uniref:CDP-2,3-bis-(O-geranylgeranyl)-sn-glycerol synthase n=1 Tax=candidate division WS6 bacterium OLB20 TaxID=1617426 RepID=A0A136LWI5_9BACT|nr:MAG: hypothetical protein TR69_WS6001001305 [candidate division WS6 bacterium OLB20]
MSEALLLAIWFFLPAGIANTVPVFAVKIPVLKNFNAPLDFGITVGGTRLLGKNKTIRGLVCGIIVGILIVWIQQQIWIGNEAVRSVIRLDYSSLSPVILGTLLAAGALVGDAVESFFKRRSGIEPGRAWFPFDQTDYIIGGILMTLPYVQLSILEYMLLFVIWFILHPISTVAGYLLKLKDSPI